MALLGSKTVHTSIVIKAPPAQVWAVLTDAPSYKEWNPTFIDVEGEYEVGKTLTNKVKEEGKVVTIKSKVIKMDENRELNQFGGIRGVLTFDHRWILEPVEGGTKVIQTETYRGIWVWFWDESWVEPAYSRANEALRDRVLEREAR